MSVLLGAPPTEDRQQIKGSKPEEPKRPAVAVERIDTFDSHPRRASNEDGANDAKAFSDWVKSARQAAERAGAFAKASVDSATAQARYAQAAWSAGMVEEATAAARSTLELIAKSPTRRDAPAAYVGLAVLLAAGMAHVAEGMYKDMPRSRAIDVLMASALIDLGQDGRADDLLADSSLASAATLRGYLRLRRQDYTGAISHLRYAMRLNPQDADVPFLLSYAYAGLGSRKRAIRYARQASLLAPGRKDISLGLLEQLIGADDYEAALAEVRKIQCREVVEPPDFLVVQARISMGLGKAKQALSILRRAREAAKGDPVLTAELQSNIAELRASLGETSNADALAVHRKAFQQAPGSVPVASMLLDHLSSTKDAEEATKVLASLNSAGHDETELVPLAAQVAYLRGDFEECLRQATAWHTRDPKNPWAGSMAAMIRGQLLEDWSGAAELILETWRITRGSWVANDAAYVLALARRPEEALAVLGDAERDDFVVRATRGLALMAAGRFESGLRCYREAAELADKTDIGVPGRSLMTVHQAMALRRLGLEAEAMPELRAGALPPVGLPDDWSNYPAFCLLREAAQRRGWKWPVFVA